MYGMSKEENDLFFTCSLIEYIARKTKNSKKLIVSKLGRENIKKMYELADVYHCENIDEVSDEFILKSGIDTGNYDHVSKCESRVPTYFEIGKVYKRLIVMVEKNKEKYVDAIIKVLSSWIVKYIDNYNSSMYYENPDYIYLCYEEGKIL